MEWKRKDIKGLEVTISHYESSLGRAWVQPEETLASEDDPSDSGAKGAKEAEMATTPVAYREDELLTGDNVVGVEGEMANLKVSSPGGYDGSDGGAST